MGGAVREAERMDELYRYADPDAPQSAAVEEIVLQAAEVAGVPMATLNLFDTERQCQVATTGFDGSATPRREAMCNISVESGAFVYVSDAREDPRFANSPWVDGRRGEVRFYASVPLITPRGYVLGTLCTFDIEPHRLSEAQITALQSLAERVVDTFAHERAA